MKKLTAFAIKAAMTRPGTYQDGDGLFLKVNKSGGAYWLLRLQRDGKRHDIGLGSAKLLSLLEARQKANELRKAVKIDRRDVLAERKDEAAANRPELAVSATVGTTPPMARMGWDAARRLSVTSLTRPDTSAPGG